MAIVLFGFPEAVPVVRRRCSLLAAAIALALAPGLSHAQRTNAILEEVLVTAQKKSAGEAVQDVGVAAPNVHLAEQGTVPHTGNFIIRGMGTAGQSIPSSDPAVGVVQDGVPFGLIYGVVTDLFDLDSIEILRGPQGTLFGRNVTGGAVVMRTNRPTDELEAKVKVTLGSHEQRDISGLVSGPFTDRLSGKLAVMYRDREGLWDVERLRDIPNPTVGDEHGASETLLIRPGIKYQGDNYDLTLLTEYAEISGDGMAPRNFHRFGIEIDPYKDNSTFTDKRGDVDMEWFSLMLEHNLDLAGGTLTTILGYRDLEQFTWGDIDGAPATVRFEFAEGSGLEQDQLSFESRWSGRLNDKWSLTAGINLFQQEYTYNERRLLIDLLEQPASSTIEHSTAGVFAQAEYAFSDDLTLILGGRYSYEKKDAAIGVIGDPGGVGTCSVGFASESGGSTLAEPVIAPPPPPFDRNVNWNECRQVFNDEESWANFSPKVGLTWTINEDVMAYASFTRGFRSGGYNVRFSDRTIVTDPDNPTSTPGPYDEEVVDAFEVGVKSQFMDGKVRLNVALFHNEYEDLQRSANNQSGVQTILNAATANVDGFEVDVVAALTDALTLEASYGYTDAGYDDAPFLEEGGGSARDFDFQMVPETTSSIALTYDHDIGSAGYLTWRGSYSYVDAVASDTFNFLLLPQYELYNASASFTTNDEKIKVAVFGRNLKDEVYSSFGFDNTAIGSKTIWLSPPRTYGVELQYMF
jgi:iron complex outermembrane receptor protein